MPKMTAKYSSALATARTAGLPVTGDQEALYQRLNAAGLWWDSKEQKWINFAAMPANEPTQKIMIRVWAEGKIVESQADEVIKSLRGKMKLLSRRGPFPCRPPEQLESRVYLEFLPGDDARSSRDEIIRENDPYAVEIE